MWVESKALWVGGYKGGGGGGVPARSKEMLLSPFSGLSIALSLLIRKLMQLSVLILESSFYSFFFLLCNLFLFRSALICAVAADDKTGHIRLLSALFYELCLGSGPHTRLFQQLCGRIPRKTKGGNFSRWIFMWSFCISLEVLCWYCPPKPERKHGLLCFKHKEAPVLRPLKCTKCWSL